MYQFSLSSPRFEPQTRVTDGKNVGVIRQRAFNALLKRPSTDRYVVCWIRTLRGKFIKRFDSEVDGKCLRQITSR